ncbi:hypothetical protein K7X08_000183 [Anisodus acutangulus]|uniref:ABC transporter domain-containing protein n=1 Tax=Anisodus acutangulus TaxID=402998 RepID=A0A9Q1M6I6_9SOLA|nr:hypothetical protein K7X08_000183 [Anisodus acutangulus]
MVIITAAGKPQAITSKKQARNMEPDQEEGKESMRLITNGNNSREMKTRCMSSRVDSNGIRINENAWLKAANGVDTKKGMILPFTPLAMSFDNVNYFVNMPPEMKNQVVSEGKLQLLRGVTGAFRPGVLTALMGVSGAGKTTLMDVLAGRKSGDYIEGDIRISGFPKRQETFARVSGYCEQTDIHSPQVTVREALIFSAFLRLPKEIFVDEVMDLVELNNLKNGIVELPGVSGLSAEQRKRLTIAVELVANPSIIFMDKPTSGLDARAAAIVVRNTVDTGRTVVCTIHQPSIDIFEELDEAIPAVPKIKEKYNPATWMLEVSSVNSEIRLGIGFAEYYNSSASYQRTKALVKELSTPPPGAKDLYFPTQYSQSAWRQFKSCLWKEWWTQWRSTNHNLVRFFFSLAAALMRETSSDIMTIIGAMYTAVLFVGINNCSTVQAIVAVGRTVFYRERVAGMYSALPYAMAQNDDCRYHTKPPRGSNLCCSFFLSFQSLLREFQSGGFGITGFARWHGPSMGALSHSMVMWRIP